MKRLFYSFFLLLSLSACGQKGPLFLTDEETKREKPTLAIDNPNAKVQPDLITFNELTISGQKTKLAQNTAVGWETVLAVGTDTQLVRYVVFDKPLTVKSPTLSMLIGHAQRKDIKGQTAVKLADGNYLRFRGLERGVDQIPTLLNRIDDYFANNPAIRHGGNKDFLVENQSFVDIYVSVEKTP